MTPKLTPTGINLRPEVGTDDLVSLHTLRHTYASILIAAGENFKYISKQLGHANIQTTVTPTGIC